MLLRHRVHEWFADRLSWVQYPNIRADLQRRARRGEPLLTPVQRLGFGLMGVFGLFAATFLLAAAVFVIWAVLTA